MVDRAVADLACKIAARAGYNPHQLVVDIDPEIDYDLLAARCAPVDIKKIKPMFMKFYDEAAKALAEERQNSALSPA